MRYLIFTSMMLFTACGNSDVESQHSDTDASRKVQGFTAQIDRSEIKGDLYAKVTVQCNPKGFLPAPDLSGDGAGSLITFYCDDKDISFPKTFVSFGGKFAFPDIDVSSLKAKEFTVKVYFTGDSNEYGVDGKFSPVTFVTILQNESPQSILSQSKLIEEQSRYTDFDTPSHEIKTYTTIKAIKPSI